MEKTVVILGGELAPEGRSLLEEAGASVIATPPYIDRQAVIETMKAHRPDAVIVRLLADLLSSEEMQAGGKLRHIAKHGVGTNDIDVKAATALGIPVSTTHTITGAIVGVGSVQRASAVRWGVAGNIVWAWIFTIPASAFVAAIAYWIGLQVF